MNPNKNADGEYLADESPIQEADLDFVLPSPTEEGIAELRALYYATYGKQIDEDSAREILSHLLTIVWNTALIHYECSNTPSTPASPTTSEK